MTTDGVEGDGVPDDLVEGSNTQMVFWRQNNGWGGSAAKSNNHHYQSKVIVCVSVISRRSRIIARMRLLIRINATLPYSAGSLSEGIGSLTRTCNGPKLCMLF